MRLLLGMATAAIWLLVAAPSQAAADPVLMGHRGTGTNTVVPENTLEAFDWAVEHGADGIEFDVRLTGTKKMVVMHDATLDRTTFCTGKVSDYSLTFVTSCRTRVGGTHPPSLSAALQYAASQPGLKVSIHVKADWPKDKMVQLASKIKYYSLESRTNVTSADKSNISDLRGQGVKRGLTWDAPFPGVAYVKSYGSYFDPRFTRITHAQVKALKDAGVVVTVWTGKTEADYEGMADLGAQRWHVDDVADVIEWASAR